MKSFSKQTRKEFIRSMTAMAGASALPGSLFAMAENKKGDKMKLGLVTYLWAKDWDIPTIIKNCTEAKTEGVELRVDHAHGVGLDMSKSGRREVKKQFAGSPVAIVGMGTNEDYHHPDPDKLKANIERTKQWLQLSRDIGGSGVKVKPNALPDGVPKEKTLEQIGKALNELGKYALDMGQQIRLEVHGRETQLLPNIATIMSYVHNNGSTVCWNSNAQDLEGNGLEYNFNLVKDDFGDICHVREFNVGDYPYQRL
ncbi:MAG: sugar phosphate isomerase/epimerase family protein, partial [Prolixibacteraceae bacterium]